VADAPPPAVVVAYVHSNDVSYSWYHSMIEMVGWDMAHDMRVLRGGYIAMRCGTDGLPEARNRAVKEFLAEKQAEWLFWIDTDMGFPADAVDRLLEVADPVDRPVVGGLCFAWREETADGSGGWRCKASPTVFDWLNLEDERQMGFAVRWDYPTDTLTRVGGTGSACILIHRSVFERIEARYGPVWYDRVPNTTTGQVLSEDLAMCLRAGTLDIPVWVHTGVKTTHAKQMWLSETDYRRQIAADLSTSGAAPEPATAEVAVIVPVLRRPGNAEPFMRSLRASTGLATVYAVADMVDEETIAAWRSAGADVIVKGGRAGERPGTFAEKVNAGYREVEEPWLFLVGDDVRFHPGWLDYAQAAAGEKFHVIGTNDLGNPRVTSGDHATHLLVRRSYVDEVGASWDGPKVVAHEGYRHMFVDDEIVTAAKQRGVWAPCLASVVEHLHPLWGKAEGDATYRLGQESAERDRALFVARLSEHAGG
jgi:hypothetical protein